MERPECRVEYRNVFLQKGESMRFYPFGGTLLFLPCPDCRAVILAGDRLISVCSEEVQTESVPEIRIVEGCYTGNIIFHADL